MNTRFHMAVGALMVLAACAALADAPAPPAVAPASKPARTIAWEELLPSNERDASNTQSAAPIHDYLGGGPAAMQARSFSVNPTLEGAVVRIPGFVVPLHISTDGRVKEFFLVPYFGACIHVPPPPPNQIVYVKLGKDVKVDSLYDAQWVTGRLHTETKYSRFGTAAYTLEGDKVEPYKY